MKYSISKIKEVTAAQILHAFDTDAVVEHLSIDTRTIHFAGSTMFIAIKTNHRNGHEFLKDAYLKGVRNFLVSEDVDGLPNSNVVRVADTVQALQQIAAYHRAQFQYDVIGITGSNGKTIVKEWLNHLLISRFNIVRSPGSYNSQIGVPLSVVEMSSENTLGIFEAGISARNEMKNLAQIIRPTIGVLTHMGDAHNAGFDSFQQKIEEKAQLFADCKSIVFNSDDESASRVLQTLAAKRFDFGKNENACVRIVEIKKLQNATDVTLLFNAEAYKFQIPFTTDAAAENAICAFAACAALHANLKSVAESMSSLPQQEMRLQLQKALNDCLIVNDSYSFDLSSFGVALNFLRQQKASYQTTVIVSDLPSNKISDHEVVISMLKENDIDRCIFIGPNWVSQKHITHDLKSFVLESTEAFLQQFTSAAFQREIILLKGAREFRFDLLGQLFLHQVHQTVMKIDLNAMVHNLRAFKSVLKPSTKVMAMVKAFGYGSGGSEPAKHLQYHGIDYLAVAYSDEGAQLRKDGIAVPIMVLNPEEAAFATIVEYNLEPEIFSFGLLNTLIAFLEEKGLKNFPIHIKLDSGMHRLGFEESDIESLIKTLAENTSVEVRSVFTHLAASEDPASDNFTREQYERFKAMTQKLKNSLSNSFIEHISNSAAILRHAELQSDMVRLGIGLYGVNPSPDQFSLQTVVYLTTTVAQIRNVKSGDTVGYNRKGVVERDSVIATLRIGYADGFRRALGNGVGRVYIKGRYAPVIGNVCMDMIMVDVTDIPGVNENDEAEILGEHITPEELASSSQTIPYEILTGISGRVKRVYVME